MNPDLTQRIISTFAPYPAPPSAVEQKSTIVDEKMPSPRQKTTPNVQTLNTGTWERQRCVSACIKTENAFGTPLSFELCTPCINSANLAGHSAPKLSSFALSQLSLNQAKSFICSGDKPAPTRLSLSNTVNLFFFAFFRSYRIVLPSPKSSKL